MSLELNIKNCSILLVGMYKNPKVNPNTFRQTFENTCEKLLEKYDHIIMLGDLNFNMFKPNILSMLCPTFNLTNLITDPTCFKSNQPTLIDVMLVTKRRKFLKSFSIDIGISDFHNLIGGILKIHAPLPPKKVILHRKMAQIDYDKVNAELVLLNLNNIIVNCSNVNDAMQFLQNTLVNALDKHAPKKQKTIKKTDFHCMTKRLKKAILIRNQSRNKFFKHRSVQCLALYRKHRNIVTLIKREEVRKYFEEKCMGGTRNKDFWKAVKPLFSRTKTKSDNVPL